MIYMKQGLLTEGLWPTIRRLARRSTHSTVAVAFLGTGASRLVPLHEGDTLVVNMSRGVVAGGQTNPYEVEKYMRRGVRAYTCANLHAKVFLFDGTLIVASSNISRHSRGNLVEAGLLTSDLGLVTQARGWLKELQFEPVTPEYVRVCKRVYKPPANHLGASTGGKPTAYSSAIWLVSTQPADFTEQENRISEKAETRLGKKIDNPKLYRVESIRFPESSFTKGAEVGDLVVQVWHEERSTKAHQPSPILGFSRYRTSRGNRVFVHIVEPKKVKTVSWKKLRETLEETGLHVGKWPERRIESVEARRATLGLWN